MSINIYEVAFTILNTLILFFILKRILFKPVGEFMAKRSNEISSNIEHAKADYAKAEKLGKEYDAKIARAESDGKKIVDEYKNKADSLYQSLVDEAKNEADLIRERAKIDAEREKEKAKDEIKKQVVVLSLLAASKSVGEQLDEERHHKLIQEFINKAGA